MGLRNLIFSPFPQEVIKKHPGLKGKDTVMPSHLREPVLCWAPTDHTLALVSLLMADGWPPPFSLCCFLLFLSRPVPIVAPPRREKEALRGGEQGWLLACGEHRWALGQSSKRARCSSPGFHGPLPGIAVSASGLGRTWTWSSHVVPASWPWGQKLRSWCYESQ